MYSSVIFGVRLAAPATAERLRDDVVSTSRGSRRGIAVGQKQLKNELAQLKALALDDRALIFEPFEQAAPRPAARGTVL